MALLSDQEIQTGLGSLPEWEREGNTIQKTYNFGSFMAGIAFVNRVAEKAEAADHHPDITIHYRKVGIALSTHSDGGLTQKDLDLAGAIETLAKPD
ncbi:MAG TPA: 4a-hydroxytetrahydrobiopterin dehydratase [Nitrospiria bacterium]